MTELMKVWREQWWIAQYTMSDISTVDEFPPIEFLLFSRAAAPWRAKQKSCLWKSHHPTCTGLNSIVNMTYPTHISCGRLNKHQNILTELNCKCRDVWHKRNTMFLNSEYTTCSSLCAYVHDITQAYVKYYSLSQGHIGCKYNEVRSEVW